MKNPFKPKDLQLIELSHEELEEVVLETRDIRAKFCGELSSTELKDFVLKSKHFVVTFKIRNYGK